jgi:hypothetical protein
MTVRVIRILEYVYPDHETAEEDQRRWNIPPNGSVMRGGGSHHMPGKEPVRVEKYMITSATMSPRTVHADEAVPLLDSNDDRDTLWNKFCRVIIYRAGAEQMCGRTLSSEGVCPQAHTHVAAKPPRADPQVWPEETAYDWKKGDDR